MGLPNGNVVLCDTKGVVYRGRTDGMNQWKSAHAVETSARTLAEAIEGADVFLGLSVKGAVDRAMVRAMAQQPIIFALANPDPEITPEEVRAVRADAIIATGRSDYPNQVNNVLGFPYIFRGALDVRASAINDAMKIAAAQALAQLAREDVPDEVAAAYAGERLRYGPDYIIPAPFDPRLIWAVPSAVAQAAMDSGVARKPIVNMEAYRRCAAGPARPYCGGVGIDLRKRAGPSEACGLRRGRRGKDDPRRVAVRGKRLWQPGADRPRRAHPGDDDDDRAQRPERRWKSTTPALSYRTQHYTEFLYRRLQRQGMLYRDCQRLVNQDRNVFAACMVACGDADAMVTGLTRNSFDVLAGVTQVIDVKPDSLIFGLTILLAREHTVLVADTLVHESPTAAQLADIAAAAAAKARELGLEPRVALLSYSNFGNPPGPDGERVREAVALLDRRHAGFEYDGEMSADVALDHRLMRQLYPFCRLVGRRQHPGHARAAQRQHHRQAAAISWRRHRGWAPTDRIRPAGADRQCRRHRLRPRQPCRLRRPRHARVEGARATSTPSPAIIASDIQFSSASAVPRAPAFA